MNAPSLFDADTYDPPPPSPTPAPRARTARAVDPTKRRTNETPGDWATRTGKLVFVTRSGRASHEWPGQTMNRWTAHIPGGQTIHGTYSPSSKAGKAQLHDAARALTQWKADQGDVDAADRLARDDARLAAEADKRAALDNTARTADPLEFTWTRGPSHSSYHAALAATGQPVCTATLKPNGYNSTEPAPASTVACSNCLNEILRRVSKADPTRYRTARAAAGTKPARPDKYDRVGRARMTAWKLAVLEHLATKETNQ